VRMIWGALAEEELNKIKERTQRGLKGRVTKKNSILPGSRPLFGYHWQDKKMMWEGKEIIVPKAIYITYAPEAKIVEAIFHWCRLGLSVRRIATMLTEMGVPTPNGNTLWRPTTVHNILTQESYTGVHFAFKRKYEYVEGSGLERTMRNKEDWVEVSDGCIPQLIDPATFEQVQKILDYNKEHSHRNNKNPEDTLCRSGIAVCGYCGSNLSVERHKARGWITYHCYKQKQGYHECKGVSARSYLVDDIAWRKTVEVILNPSLVEEKIAKQRIEDPTKGTIQAAEQVITENANAIINLTRALESTSEPTARSILTHRLEELAKLHAGYEDQYDKTMRFRINWEEAMRSLDDFKAWCDRERPRLTDPDYLPTYKERREALEKIGIRVIVFRQERRPRFEVEVSPPDIMGKFRIASKSSQESSIHPAAKLPSLA
jgi:site-specific DNA recombinase